MGCTSSAPNYLMPSSPTVNATVQTEIEDVSEKENNQIYKTTNSNADLNMELPACDSLAENVDIAAVASGIEAAVVASQIDPPMNLETFADHFKDIAVEKSEVSSEKNKTEAGEKFTTMEEVVEKVVELLEADVSASPKNVISELPLVRTINEEDVLVLDIPSTGGKKETSSEEAEESPGSASEPLSSRATRWEALADIAAELPPSLTVDPLTGQIYKLTK